MKMEIKQNAGVWMRLGRLKENKVLFAYLIAVALFFVGGVINPGFLHFQHIINILSLSSFLGIVVLAQTIVILCGGEGIDLSVGSFISLATVIASQMLGGENQNLFLTLFVVLGVGFLLGLVNGGGVAFFKIPPLVMTLAMGSVVQGIALIYTQGQPKGKACSLLTLLGTGRTLSIPNILLLWLVITLVALLVLERMRIGKILYGVGENEITAELCGIRTLWVRFFTYGFSGMIAAFAGICLLGYTGTSYLDLGSAYIMPSVAAAVIGGITLAGGNGSYIGAVAGAVILTTINSLMICLKAGEGGRKIVYGMVILVVLFLYSKREKN